MNVRIINNVTVTEKEIFDFIINPNNFDEEDTRNEDGTVNNEGVILCFQENVKYCIAGILKINKEQLNITQDDRREYIEFFKTYLFSHGK